MLILQSSSYSVVTKIVDTAGSPLIGLTATDISAFIKKQSSSAFSQLTLVTNSNFVNNGNGYYTITLTTSQTDTLGSLYVLLKGALFPDVLVGLTVVVAGTSIPSSPSYTVGTTQLFGSIIGTDGNPVSGAAVTANLLGSPAVVSSGSVGVGVANGSISTKTDSNGYFVLTVVTNLTYEVYIPSINYRRSIAVANSTPINVFGA